MKTILIYIAFMFAVLATQAQKRQNLRILFVGNSPETVIAEDSRKNSAWVSQERYKDEIKTRMPAFESYLKKYFKTVETIDVNDYTASLSKSYDVTIFDESVKPLKERIYESDPETGQTIKYEPAVYLPEDFDYPSLFIGHPAATMGKSLGSKLDWYCLCLTKWAHSIKTDHPIFKGPFKVDLTLKNRPTPSPITHYFDGGNMPAEIPMWTVNTEDYTDGNGYRIGMVARGWEFEDSPEAEVISSGQCDKQKTAVAIGRHGNFFLWGFAGSPDYMTEEAKQVFANAVVYTHKHASDKIIARKFNDRIATKIYLDELIFSCTEKAYEENVKTYTAFNKSSLEVKQKALEKKKTGEKLTEMEEMMLDFEPQPIATREQFIAKSLGRLAWAKKLLPDTDKVIEYINNNRDYFYSEPTGFYDLKVDEDCKSLGIANTDIKILDKAIRMLEADAKNAMAKRILYRYTVEDFNTSKEWRTWFTAYNKKMFFTQTGGFVWMVNDIEVNSKTKPRDDNEFIKKETISIDLETPTDKNPVSIGATLLPSENEGERSVLIKANIMAGYHIYAYVPAGEAYIVTTYGVELPNGVTMTGDWEKTAPTPYAGKVNILTYKNEVEFTHALKISNTIPEGTKIKVWFKYQCCDANICFPPAKKEFELTL